ncbi:MAG: class I SAM-dependent methyltransferase [Tepidisphaeraceae bacterium]
MQNTPRRAVARLQHRLARRFDLIDDPIAVGPLRVRLTRVADPEKVLDDLCARIDLHERLTGQRVQGDHLGLPYWAELWESSIGLGAWLLGAELINRHAEKRLSVLDLGCGVGLAGTVAAMLGADVLFGDIERDCLLFARLNGLRYSPRVRARRVNWQSDDLGERFDLILGSDVLYDSSQWAFLEPFFRRHLAPAGRVLLGEPGRPTGENFVPWIRQRGWSFREYEQRIATRLRPIRLFELTA